MVLVFSVRDSTSYLQLLLLLLTLFMFLLLLQAGGPVLPHGSAVKSVRCCGTTQCGVGGSMACFRLQPVDPT